MVSEGLGKEIGGGFFLISNLMRLVGVGCGNRETEDMGES